MSTQKLPHDPLQSTFADRIKLLIQRVGSATEIARMCGFSEGVVRSWRDGNTDPSRARCVTMARTLGISLVWLVAGEGALQIDPSTAGNDDAQYSSETVTHRARGRIGGHSSIQAGAEVAAVDPRRLNTAMQILQSELELANSPMTLADNTDMLSNLYEILGSDGSSVNATAMLKFNRQLSERIRQAKAPQIA
ncbi:helix-turn-helix transcriptional regulator [Rhodanobacter sp. DHB23]|uniref:helix-turn-helix domain-containing protein n=1 Tax=Rhodanobacter sp. DHB23 TaxID=2775923 RepID=UPI00177DE279|nr:helix-turn-helix transcriptional regulator [Rhodanobacter sp. DHB23]MBD8872614.1 helix-turn-helix transcriptional regulator [Rhodanobacter sp. DHB23]